MQKLIKLIISIVLSISFFSMSQGKISDILPQDRVINEKGNSHISKVYGRKVNILFTKAWLSLTRKNKSEFLNLWKEDDREFAQKKWKDFLNIEKKSSNYLVNHSILLDVINDKDDQDAMVFVASFTTPSLRNFIYKKQDWTLKLDNISYNVLGIKMKIRNETPSLNKNHTKIDYLKGKSKENRNIKSIYFFELGEEDKKGLDRTLNANIESITNGIKKMINSNDTSYYFTEIDFKIPLKGQSVYDGLPEIGKQIASYYFTLYTGDTRKLMELKSENAQKKFLKELGGEVGAESSDEFVRVIARTLFEKDKLFLASIRKYKLGIISMINSPKGIGGYQGNSFKLIGQDKLLQDDDILVKERTSFQLFMDDIPYMLWLSENK